jgi:hypothetical protein
MSLRIIGAVVLLLLAGCDRSYGVESRTSLKGPVDVGCVDLAIRSVAGAGKVDYRRSEDRSTEIYPKQRKVVTAIHLWLYGEGGSSTLQINQTPDAWEFTNARLRMGSPVPEDEIARFVRLMRIVNSTLADRCGLPVGSLRPQRL